MPTLCPPPILSCDGAAVTASEPIACRLADGTPVTARLSNSQVIVSFVDGTTAAFAKGATSNDLSPLFRRIFHLPDCGEAS